MNLLTKDNQCAYTAKKSTPDAIYYIEQNILKNKIICHSPFGLSKAFGRIDRNKLWRSLYGKVLPIKLIKMIIEGQA